VDGAGGNFIPLSTSSVLDAATTNVTGYVPLDIRGFNRHDAQAKEPNTGTGSITYADIGPYEFDASETPSVPDVSIVTGNTDMVVSWVSTQYNGDESSLFGVFVAGGMLASGTPAPLGGTNCFRFAGLNPCSIYPVYVKITDVNTGIYSTTPTVNAQTKCSGSQSVACGLSPRASMSAGTDGGDTGHGPAEPELAISRAATGRVIAYGLPAALAGSSMDLSVFDVAGRRVLSIDRGPSRAGRFAVPLGHQGADLRRAGVYFARLRVGSVTLRKTFVVW
jgi:hypothetical protein